MIDGLTPLIVVGSTKLLGFLEAVLPKREPDEYVPASSISAGRDLSVSLGY
jgi:hypothetical protein